MQKHDVIHKTGSI